MPLIYGCDLRTLHLSPYHGRALSAAMVSSPLTFYILHSASYQLPSLPSVFIYFFQFTQVWHIFCLTYISNGQFLQTLKKKVDSPKNKLHIKCRYYLVIVPKLQYYVVKYWCSQIIFSGNQKRNDSNFISKCHISFFFSRIVIL